MKRPVKMLTDLEIDEISVVDRPANQHGLIAFSKNAGTGEGPNDQEEQMPVFTDAEGVPVDTDTLEHGDFVYDETGTEYVFSADGVDDQDDELDDEPTPTYERELVGAGVGKSAGESILEELSKAATQGDKDEVIAKAVQAVANSDAKIIELSKALEEEQDLRITEAYIAKADEYNLPVSPGVLGPILKAVAEVLTDDQLDVLDQLFTSVSDSLYEEIGYVGDTDNGSVISTVDAMAAELVSKSGGDVTTAEAMVALFEANPDSYDAYNATNGR